MTELLHDPATHHLGKREPKPPRLMIRDYVDVERALPAAPATVVNSAGQSIALAMYLNDAEGDCTIAGAGNTLRVNSKGQKQITDSDVQAAYVAVTGQEGAAFSPGPPPVNDNGCVEVDVLDHWVNPGIGGDKLQGHAGVDMTNLDEVRVVCWLFGSVYPGWQLDVAQQSQTIWDYVSGSPGWGGHCAPIFDVDPSGGWLGTWGAYKRFTSAFLTGQADEGHALITAEWLTANQSNPLVNASALAADLSQLQSET